MKYAVEMTLAGGPSGPCAAGSYLEAASMQELLRALAERQPQLPDGVRVAELLVVEAPADA